MTFARDARLKWLLALVVLATALLVTLTGVAAVGEDNISVTLTASDNPSNLTSANLTASINATIPGHTYIHDWRVNGTSIAVVNMPFDTNYSATTTNGLKSYSTQGRNGTLGNGNASRVPLWNTSGISGGAYVFDGANDWISLGSNVPLHFNNQTVEFWFNPREVSWSGETRLVDGNYYGIHFDSAICNSMGKLCGFVHDGVDFRVVDSAQSFTAGNWYYVVLTWDAAGVRFYVNSVFEGQNSSYDGTIGVTSDEVGVGARRNGAAFYFNGTIDELRIFNRSISLEQVNATYANGVSRYNLTVSNETTVGDVWSVVVTPNNFSQGDGISATSNTVTILAASTSSENLTCSFVAGTSCPVNYTKLFGVENDTGGYLNAHVQNATENSYANSVCCSITNRTVTNACGTELLRLESSTGGHVEQTNESNPGYTASACFDADQTSIACQYEDGACSTGYVCILSMINANEDGNDATNAHVGTCDDYTRKLCCSVSLVNQAPTAPTLLLPTDDNQTLTNRYVTFNWTQSTDPDGDAITYQWNITAPAGCAALPIVNTSNTYYTSVDKLCVDNTYNWTVRACDTSDACSAWAMQFNFTIMSTIGVSFTTEEIDFGNVQASLPSVNSTNDTLANSPQPLVYNNTGNVDLVTMLKANASLWALQPLNTSYFQYGDENASSWLNVTANYTALASNVTLAQLRELEIRIWVPQAETPGAKNVGLTVLGASNE